MKYFIIIRTNRTALYSNIHACDICKSRSTRYSALTFLNKTFICNQYDRNYISMLIKFYNQITEVNHTSPMRILYIVISTTYWLFNVSVHATLENSVARVKAGSSSKTSLRPGWLCHRCHSGRDRGGRYGTSCRKFVANPSKSVNSFFWYFIKINHDVFKIISYILFKAISSK